MMRRDFTLPVSVPAATGLQVDKTTLRIKTDHFERLMVFAEKRELKQKRRGIILETPEDSITASPQRKDPK